MENKAAEPLSPLERRKLAKEKRLAGMGLDRFDNFLDWTSGIDAQSGDYGGNYSMKQPAQLFKRQESLKQ